VPGGSRSYPEDHQRGGYHRSRVVHGPLLIARGYPAPLLELIYAPLDHVAPAVGLTVELRWPTPTALALVLALGDDVRNFMMDEGQERIKTIYTDNFERLVG